MKIVKLVNNKYAVIPDGGETMAGITKAYDSSGFLWQSSDEFILKHCLINSYARAKRRLRKMNSLLNARSLKIQKVYT